jgi:CheY-like chemotaxis protein
MNDRGRANGSRRSGRGWVGHARLSVADLQIFSSDEGKSRNCQAHGRKSRTRRGLRQPPLGRPDSGTRSSIPRVLIVHGHRLVAEALRTILEEEGFHIVGLLPSREEAVATVRRARPELVLLDLESAGFGATGEILKAAGKAKIVGLTADPEADPEMPHGGVHRYVTWESPPSSLIQAVRALL